MARLRKHKKLEDIQTLAFPVSNNPRGWTLLNHGKGRGFTNVHWLEDVNGHSSWQQLNEEISPRYPRGSSRYFSRSISSTGRPIDSWNTPENYWGVGKVGRKLAGHR